MTTALKLTAYTLVVVMGFVTGFGATREGKRTHIARATLNGAAD